MSLKTKRFCEARKTRPGFAKVCGKPQTSGDDVILSGIPAFENREWLCSIPAFRHPGEKARTVYDLERRLAVLELSVRTI